jgi:hypothetical protein
LMIAAACLPHERNKPLDPVILSFCENLIFHNKIDPHVMDTLLVRNPLKGSEARILLACAMFCGNTKIDKGGSPISIQELLASIITVAKTKDLLPRNDPFYTEALYFLEGMSEDSSTYK